MSNPSRGIRIAAAGATIGAALAAAPGPALAAATTTTTHTHADFGTFVEEQTHCTNEPVRWTGGYDLVVTSVAGPTSTVRSLQYTQQLTGVGLTSGAPYVLNAVYHETVRTGTAGATVRVMPEVYVQISEGGLPNYLFHGVTVQVVDANGVVVVDPGDDSHAAVTCVG